VSLLRGDRHTSALAGRVHVQRGHSSSACSTQPEAIPPSQRNRDVPQCELRPHGRDTGRRPTVIAKLWRSVDGASTLSARSSVISTGLSRRKFGQDNSNEGICLDQVRLAGARHASEGAGRQRAHRGAHRRASGVSELFRSQLALRKSTSTTRMTPKRVCPFYRRILTGRETPKENWVQFYPIRLIPLKPKLLSA